jgi:uncharacterized protein (TIGR02594 family)
MKSKLLRIAEQDYGVAEIPGPKNNPKIVAYHASTDTGPDSEDTSWCSSAVNFWVEKAGYKGTGSKAARSWLDWGREPNDDEYKGCICVLWRGSPDGWQGHVGLLVDWTDDQVCLLGGNQNNRVSRAWFPVERVLGYRVPV